MQIAIPLFAGFTALDAVGPHEILARMPGADVVWVAAEPGPVRADTGVAISAQAAYEDAPSPDVVLVPGGDGTRRALHDEHLLRWLRRAHETSTWTASVCTGALLLAAAGITRGVDSTTHWATRDLLAELGANPVAERVVERGKVITGAGVSAGIDLALTLAARIHGDDLARALQLGVEYDPQPPFDTGAPEKAPPHLVAAVRAATPGLAA